MSPEHEEYRELAAAHHEMLRRLDLVEYRVDALSKETVNYITRDKFAPVQSFVWGMVSVILLGVLAGVLRLLLPVVR